MSTVSGQLPRGKLPPILPPLVRIRFELGLVLALGAIVLEPMSTILTVHEYESSEGDYSKKYKRTHKLMLILSDVPKKAITKFSCRLST